MENYSKLFDLTGKRALVIGAAKGIGQAGCFGLASHGAHVVCGDIDMANARETAATIKAAGHSAEALHVDLSDAKSIADAAAAVGAPDVLVVTPAINVRKRLVDISDDEFDRVIGLNLKGAFRAFRAFAPRMAARGGGSIIAFSSVRAMVVEPGQGVYAATKAGTLQMVRALAAEFGERGVRANVIAPGVVETPLTLQIKQNEAWYRAYADKSMLRRWAQPSELAGALIFLASNASSYVTGSYLLVDGGWTAADGRFSPPLPTSTDLAAS
ncbi:MAG TPA: SDR family NAD(P)-dependent oxidoreductase [Bradyrhizobium sp.]|uniref:SDR family NAD(P)-dependent oxidoreductase n=1 Tax=Bradyrhizobium sp. TaxID=376 RepID=UPI002C43CB5B|nr:SDR family NAD(P)-dependent oxidoreductase [Bradyrhizobium sp.]HLZ02901.1 SDR family NAD(P)-dependent oxidoreductase [Bradyrhizobium sp.]